MKFVRQKGEGKKKLGDKWRKPKGVQSKVRLQFKGRKRIVKIGYGLSSSSKIVTVHSLGDLAKNKGSSVVIASSVGMRKKKLFLEEAKKHNIKFKNLKDDFLSIIDERLAKRREARKKKFGKKKTKKVVVDNKQEKKSEKEVSPDDKKKEMLKEKEKVLTKK